MHSLYGLLSASISVLLLAGAGITTAQVIEHPIRMPAVFHDVLIYVEPVSEDGDTLRFFTDSADGTIMYQGSVDRLGLTTTSAIIQDQQQLAAFLPPMDSSHFIPPPLISDGLIPVRADDRMPPHHRVILRGGGNPGDDTRYHRNPDGNPGDGSQRAAPPENGILGDGILGSTWFAGRAWTIDFRRETFHVVPTGHVDAEQVPPHGNGGAAGDPHHPPENPDNQEAVVSISFYEEGDQRRYHFARLPVVVAGDTLSMVLKTGSHIVLSDEVDAELGRADELFPAGLISESVAEDWLREHPDWRVYERADRNYGSDLIEVPEVHIGPHSAGPVHFAVRRDEAFDDWFSQFTDEPVTGALGADAFRDAHITVNYPRSVLIFHE